MVLKVVEVKDPVLRLVAKPIAKVDKKILGLIEDMKDTLTAQKDPEGVGLAAPQVGKSLRLFVVDYKKLQRVVINPEVLKIEKKLIPKKKSKKEILEGCLSLPHFYGPIERNKSITIKYLNETGKTITETFEGFNAQIIQHEIDHLNGVLFVDKILEQNAPIYRFDGDEWEEVELA
jgi:peptide deformylase